MLEFHAFFNRCIQTYWNCACNNFYRRRKYVFLKTVCCLRQFLSIIVPGLLYRNAFVFLRSFVDAHLLNRGPENIVFPLFHTSSVNKVVVLMPALTNIIIEQKKNRTILDVLCRIKRSYFCIFSNTWWLRRPDLFLPQFSCLSIEKS